MIAFEVYGDPAPKGSMKLVRGRLIPSNPHELSRWAKNVAGAAHAAMYGGRHAVYVERELVVRVEFRLLRPRGHLNARGSVKAGAPLRPCVKPDLDKLLRGVLDPLTGLVFDDDSRIVETIARKVYAEHPGAALRVYALDEVAALLGTTVAQPSLFEPTTTDERSTP